jgi:hypothetical protein
MRTVKDLKNFMEKHKASPEKLCKIIKISNMTIRRILKKRESSLLPDKYSLHFEHLKKVSAKTLKPKV